MKRDIYGAITERFIEQFETRNRSLAEALVRRPEHRLAQTYRGINALPLGSTDYQSPFWISFKQALGLGGNLKKGEKSTPVIYYKILEKRDESGNMMVREDGRPAHVRSLGECFQSGSDRGRPSASNRNSREHYPA